MADWARLLSECWGLNLSRGFESLPPRHKRRSHFEGVFFFHRRVPEWGCYSNPSLPAKENALCMERVFRTHKQEAGFMMNLIF